MSLSNRANLLAVVGLAGAAQLVASCAGITGGVPVSQTYYDYSFVGSEVGYARQFGPVPVFVRGNLFANDRDNQAVIAVMNENHVARGLTFVPASAPSASGYSVVLAQGSVAGGVNYCAGRADFPLAPSSSGGTQITGTFCLAGRLRSQAVVSVGAAGAGASAAIDILTSALLSPPRPREDKTNE